MVTNILRSGGTMNMDLKGESALVGKPKKDAKVALGRGMKEVRHPRGLQ